MKYMKIPQSIKATRVADDHEEEVSNSTEVHLDFLESIEKSLDDQPINPDFNKRANIFIVRSKLRAFKQK